MYSDQQHSSGHTKEQGGGGGGGQEGEKETAQKKVSFSCKACGFSQDCSYFGDSPPFCKNLLRFKEECFVMIDPFSPKELKTGSGFVLIGSMEIIVISLFFKLHFIGSLHKGFTGPSIYFRGMGWLFIVFWQKMYENKTSFFSTKTWAFFYF